MQLKTICTAVSVVEQTDKGFTTLKVDAVTQYRRCHLSFNIFKKSLLKNVEVGSELERTYVKDTSATSSFLKLIDLKFAEPHHTCDWCCSEVLNGSDCECIISERSKYHGTFRVASVTKKKYRYSEGVRLQLKPGGNDNALWSIIYENHLLYETAMELAVDDEVMATVFTSDEETQWGEVIFINAM